MSVSAKRIIFVDETPQQMEGLEQLLTLRPEAWELTFVQSGEELLQLMGREPYDVVVTDLRMPGMDGGHLSKALQDLYPEVARIVLSVHSNQECAFGNAHPMHFQVLQPCDAKTMQTTIQRAVTLQELLSDRKLKVLTSRTKNLPTKPTLYDQVTRKMAEARCSICDIGDLVAQDVGMSAKILKLANSARFGLRRQVSDPVQAAIVLGLETVRDFVLAMGVAAQFSGIKLKGFNLDRFCDRSLKVANYAKLIATHHNAPEKVREDAFTSGLLLDIGQLVLMDYSAEKYQEVLSRISSDPDQTLTLWDAECDVFGVSHPSIGAFVLGRWGLPQSVIETVGFHHRPSRLRHDELLPVTFVHAADCLERQQHRNQKPWESEIDPSYLESLGLTESQGVWKEICGDNQAVKQPM